MKYILNDQYCLCGYRNLPFALYNSDSGETFFFTRDEYSLLLDCDGQTDIMIRDLEDDKQTFIRSLINRNVITMSDTRNLKPHQEYHKYDVFYKDNIQFSITGRCNYKCKHCFMSAPHAKYDEMSLEDCKEVLKQLKECGIRNIQITGGEPLAHPKFKEIIKELSKQGIHLTTLYTNGLLLKQDIIDLFNANKQHPKIQISFDGIGYHDWLRGVENAEKYAIEAIKLCVQNNFETEVAMVLFKDNIDSIRDTIKYLDSLGVSNVRISNVINLGEWLVYADKHGIDIKEVYDKYLEYIPLYFEDNLHTSISLGGFFSYNTKQKQARSTFENNCDEDRDNKYFLCKSLKQAFYIASNGLVLPCPSMMSTKVEDNALSILEHDLKDIINDSYLNEIGNRKAVDFLQNNKKCNECKYKYLCLGGCRANALAKNNNYYDIDDAVCAYYLNGYKEKKDELLKSLNIKQS